MARLRPYLVRATYDWIVDHNLMPYFLVDAEADKVEVPWEYVEDGKIVLNVSPDAIHDLRIEHDFVGFEASFSGEVQQIFLPTEAVLAVYARETGQGLYAREDEVGMLVNEGEPDELDPTPPESKKKPGANESKGRFKIVK